MKFFKKYVGFFVIPNEFEHKSVVSEEWASAHPVRVHIVLIFPMHI